MNVDKFANGSAVDDDDESDDGVPLSKLAGKKVMSESSTKKSKGTKSRKSKKKGQQKPMTAYMLFFRDTYTAVKNTHPLASFGDVSKIAAGMWDSLDDKTKEMYKRKATEEKYNHEELVAVYKGEREPMEHSTMEVYEEPESDDEPVSSPETSSNATGRKRKGKPVDKDDDDYMPEDHEKEVVEHSQAEYEAINGRPQLCAYKVCGNLSVRSRRWDYDYCSSRCVINHCKEHFAAWVQSRNSDNTEQSV